MVILVFLSSFKNKIFLINLWFSYLPKINSIKKKSNKVINTKAQVLIANIKVNKIL